MTPERLAWLEELFENILEVPANERVAWLVARTKDDTALADDVLRLVDAHDHGGAIDRIVGVLNPASTREVPTAGSTRDEPKRIGPWSITAQIGSGGMGSVFLAERADGQYQRRVALKLLRRDLIEPELHRRFLAERQILARVEHPGIARLIDAGVTDEGRPWFVMELVEGRPIDQWCDAHHASIERRLALFLEVCAAVQHAHRNLVVHRDIKPSNILVTTHGSVKLLDFGIAKILDPQAYPDTGGRTRTGAMLLTPEYAAPEQLRGESVTTASDVFQLGLLLFQLLTGRRPAQSGGATRDRPSATVTGDKAEMAASQRGTTPQKLRRRLAGDLDTITESAMRPEPDRRYGSVELLAQDIQRHLAGLPVGARPDTLRYRAGKFIRRHRAGVAVALTIVLLLAGFGAAMAVQARRLARERDRAQRVSALLGDLFTNANPNVAQGREVTVREVLETGEQRVHAELADQPELRAQLIDVLAGVYRGLGDFQRALDLEREVLEAFRATNRADHPQLAVHLGAVSTAHVELGNLDSALAYANESLRVLRRSAGPRDARLGGALLRLGFILNLLGRVARADSAYQEGIPILRLAADSNTLAAGLNNWGWVAANLGDSLQAEARLRESLAIRRVLVEREGAQIGLANSLASLGDFLVDRGRLDEAEQINREQVELVNRLYTPPHPAIATAALMKARIARARGNAALAERGFLDAIEMTRQIHGDSTLQVANQQNELGLFYSSRGQYDKAEPLYRAAHAAYRAARGSSDPGVARLATNLAWALHSLGRSVEADQLYREAKPVFDAELASGRPVNANSLVDWAVVLITLKQYDEALPIARRGVELQRKAAPETSLAVLRAMAVLGESLTGLREFAEAEALLLAVHSAYLSRGSGDIYFRRNLGRLVSLYTAWGREAEASKFRGMLGSAP